jgi:hypothetical protein
MFYRSICYHLDRRIKDEEAAAVAVSSVREISEYCISIMVKSEYNWKSLTRVYNLLVNIELLAEVISRIAWQVPEARLDNTWFRRIWYYQRAQLGRSVIVYWGSHRLDWAHPGITSIWIIISAWSSAIRPEDTDLSSLSFQESAMFAEPTVEYSDVLLDTLVSRRYCEATDPQDMVYGLLGLLTPHLSRTTNVDHSKSTSTVYTDIASLRLENLGKELLKEVGHPADFDGCSKFPSWVPQWQIPLHHYRNVFLDDHNASCGIPSALARPPTIQVPKL